LALGTSEIPDYAGKINATWFGQSAPADGNTYGTTSDNGPSQPQQHNNEVEMAEEVHRGRGDEDE
jgi:hypothetical protein